MNVFLFVSVHALASKGGTAIPISVLDATPDFIGQIQNVTVAIGREAILTCRVNDLGHYKVGWMKADDQTILSLHTRVVTHNPRITVTNDDNFRIWQLHIRQLRETDRGCYMCQINTNRMKKQFGCVDVQVPPDIDDAETSSDVTVSEGENVTLACKASGHPSPRILWRREDGDHLHLQFRTLDTERVDTYSGPKLNLLRIDRRQMGAYLCIASNDVPPAVSKRIVLNVKFPPIVKVPNQLVGTPLNTDVQLECYIEAYPYTINYWMKNREMIMNGKKHSITEGRQGYRVSMTLIIRNVLRRDIGTYSCVSTNSLGKINGTIRLYEIKLQTRAPTTTTTATTTTTTTTTEKATDTTIITYPPTPLILLTEVNIPLRDVKLNNYIPSVKPAPLEIVLTGNGSPAIIEPAPFHLILLLLVINYYR
ncbi:hypothetical protein RI129_012705 [Pyrocoelia pectoralis]|uniref:Ig-like domain-containing protein n=1 Tax=Pyrocoelia pectoralis TaxID=417401 RepID=A0AAN7UU16_9COLE